MDRNRKGILRAALIAGIFAMFISSASAAVEIVDFFSDFTSSDVTIRSSHDFQGTVVFELFYAGGLVETQKVPFKGTAGEPLTKVIVWKNQPQFDYYTARVSVNQDSILTASSSYPVSYGTVSLPNFHVVGFSPTNSGVQLLLRPFNPSVVDIKIELLDANDIVYTKTTEDMSLTTTTELKLSWPFLLLDRKGYTVRTKIFTHRLYAPPLINTYVANFTATEDAEILQEDVEVDEFGVSVTIRGKSQVPFDGYIVVQARNRRTNESHLFRQQVEEILVSGKEDTAGIVWRGLDPGTYDVEIQAVNENNVTIDKYETVLRIPEIATAAETAPAQSAPGFLVLAAFIILFAAARWVNKDRDKTYQGAAANMSPESMQENPASGEASEVTIR